MATCVGVAGGLGAWALHQQGGTSEHLQRLDAVARQVQQMRYYNADVSGWQGWLYAQAEAESPATAVDPAGANISGLEADRQAGDALLAGFDEAVLTADERQVLQQLRTQWADYFTVTDTYVEQVREGSPQSLEAAYATLNGPLDASWRALLDSTEQLADSVDARAGQQQELAAARETRLKAAVLVATVLAVVLSTVLAPLVTRSITRPLARTLHVVQGLAEGRLDQRVGISTGDEVGQLAGAVDATMERLAATMRRIAGNAGTLASSSEELTSVATQLSSGAEEAATQAQVVSAATEEISANIATVAAAGDQMSS
ncbi:HAMP domain-containing protein, partial [Kineococcus sp. SYSU DK006]|uniref:HAMP domain-containing protein n=1 Tax=Kineococcus sp. SYSU DK006 TaxID=3383127 RepID=UPI003D7E345A